ncbi:MAG: hypothetical protein RBQ91_00980 [Acholeplasma sp.]|nr:hypothetical protein [Acholeplasma sp.]
MRDKRILQLTLTAVFVTIILVMSLLPQVGFITIMPGVSVTLVHIPVLVGVFLLDRRNSIILGLFMGLGSMIAAYIYGATPFDLAFQLPWISVIPRVLFAWLAFEITNGFRKVEQFKLGKLVLFAIVSFLSSFALFYGSKSIVHANAFSTYQATQTEIATLNEEASNPNTDPVTALASQLKAASLELSLPDIYEDAVTREANVLKVVTPLVLLLIVAFIVTYYWYIEKNQGQFVFIPSVLIVSTITHTILVLTTIALFKPVIFSAGFTDTISIIYGIAMTNGLIEALVAVLVGSPIIVGILNFTRKEA